MTTRPSVSSKGPQVSWEYMTCIQKVTPNQWVVPEWVSWLIRRVRKGLLVNLKYQKGSPGEFEVPERVSWLIRRARKGLLLK
jgi:hypothetical protein